MCTSVISHYLSAYVTMHIRVSKRHTGRRDGLRHAQELLLRIVREVCRNAFDLLLTSSLLHWLGYGGLIRTYVQFILAKLRFHRLRPEFNGLFEYDEYITQKGIDDPNDG